MGCRTTWSCSQKYEQKHSVRHWVFWEFFSFFVCWSFDVLMSWFWTELDPERSWKISFKVRDKCDLSLIFVYLNFPGVIKNYMQSKSFELNDQLNHWTIQLNDTGKNAIFGIPQSWCTLNHEISSWIVGSRTHRVFRCDTIPAKKGRRGNAFWLMNLVPGECHSWKIFNESTRQSGCLTYRRDFSNLTYKIPKYLFRTIDDASLNVSWE